MVKSYPCFSKDMEEAIPMKVYGYVRVSTTEQATNGESLETQKAKVTGYAMMQGWEVADIFV
ncbi:recombinase family protein, partial [Klebsiella pneumoniae]|nr:recombinase family protein [Klebsiella pneumoniae]